MIGVQNGSGGRVWTVLDLDRSQANVRASSQPMQPMLRQVCGNMQKSGHPVSLASLIPSHLLQRFWMYQALDVSECVALSTLIHKEDGYFWSSHGSLLMRTVRWC